MKRRRATPAQRLRPFWILFVVALVLIAVGAYFLATWKALYPHTIEVSGNAVVSKDAILEAAQIDLYRNIWLQNTGAMQTRIEAIPYIDTASVKRRPPGNVLIAVTERVPFAILDSAGTQAVVDRTLRALRPAGPQDATLPVLIASPGQNTQTLAETAEEAQEAHLQPAMVKYDKYGDVEMFMGNKVRVLFGDPATVAQKMPMIAPILKKVERGNRKVAALDLRAITTPVVEYAK